MSFGLILENLSIIKRSPTELAIDCEWMLLLTERSSGAIYRLLLVVIINSKLLWSKGCQDE